MPPLSKAAATMLRLAVVDDHAIIRGVFVTLVEAVTIIQQGGKWFRPAA